MAQSLIQPSFAGGELAPNMAARVDTAKYHVGAKTLRNFFVLVSGGVSSRPGTRFVGRAKDSAHPVRLIPFQFSTLQTYVLEFGHQYMRVVMDGGYVLEPSLTVTAITRSAPAVVSYAATMLGAATPANAGVTTSYSPGDTVTLAGGTRSQPAIVTVAATTLLSTVLTGGGSGYAAGDTLTLAGGSATVPASLTVTAVSGGAITAFSLADGGQYSANAAAFTQAATSGTGSGATFGTPLFGAGALSVDVAGSYSATPADPAAQAATSGSGAGLSVTCTWAPWQPLQDGDWVFLAGIGGMSALNSTPATPYVVANAAPGSFALTTLDGAPVDATALPAFTGGGATVARIYTLATPYAGSDLALLKFTQSADVMTLCHPAYPPTDLDRTQHWAWRLVPITFQPKVSPPAGTAATPKGGGGSQYYSYVVTALGPTEESLPSAAANCQNASLNQDTGVINTVSWVAVAGATGYRVYKAPVGTTGPIPAGAIYGYIGATSGTGFDDANIEADATTTPPQGVNPFTDGNNPGCVTYYQQRKVFGGSASQPETLWMSQSGNFDNMDVSSPSQDDDAITATLASCQVNAIKHLVSVNGLLALTASGSFMVSGGGSNAVLTPTQTVVLPQAYNGCSDVPPLVINYDILFVQAMGSIVRDLSYNFYVNLYTGTDLTVLSSHLFFGHQILEWCWAEEPYKLVWAVRDDGVALALTYLKEQDIYAWSHHDTLGRFASVTSVPEGSEDSVYFVVSRLIPGVNGGQPVQYIERLSSRNFLSYGPPAAPGAPPSLQADVTQGWFVDCGLKYQGAPTSTVAGLAHLEGAEVSILADGSVQPPQTVNGGTISLQHPAATVIVGLPFTADLATLDIDAGEPTIQGKRKKISAVTLRLENSRGLKVGPDADSLVEIKERGDQGYGQPIPLTTGDERILIAPSWNTAGSIWVRQDNPLPATVLGVIPEIRIGDAPG